MFVRLWFYKNTPYCTTPFCNEKGQTEGTFLQKHATRVPHTCMTAMIFLWELFLPLPGFGYVTFVRVNRPLHGSCLIFLAPKRVRKDTLRSWHQQRGVGCNPRDVGHFDLDHNWARQLFRWGALPGGGFVKPLTPMKKAKLPKFFFWNKVFKVSLAWNNFKKNVHVFHIKSVGE